MALCVEQTRQTVAALDIRRSQVDDEVTERFSSLLEEVNSFQESLANPKPEKQSITNLLS